MSRPERHCDTSTVHVVEGPLTAPRCPLVCVSGEGDVESAAVLAAPPPGIRRRLRRPGAGSGWGEVDQPSARGQGGQETDVGGGGHPGGECGLVPTTVGAGCAGS